MRSELAAKLLGVVVIALPLVALAASGAATSTVLTLGVLVVTLALLAAIAPLSPRASAVVELDEVLERLESEIEEVGGEWSAKVARAQTAGRFREEFVATVRHELRTPLNAILGFADILLADVDGILEPRQREDVDAIRSAGGHLNELVDAVLAEWNPQHGTPLPMDYVDVGALLEQVAQILRGQLAGRAIEIRVEVPPDLRGPLADERRLRQILINLGTNALRATSAGAVTFSAASVGDQVHLSVRDTGAGIEPDALPTLFTPFTQAGSADSREGGSGLGLSLVREMVEWHGGYIDVESTRGVGTCFSVVLWAKIP